MEAFVNFLNANKTLLCALVSIVLSVILIFIKRRPKTIDDFFKAVDEVIVKMPTFINKVECPSNGLAKKKEVLTLCNHLLVKRLGRSLSESELDYSYDKFNCSLESILSTPQKKEVC